MIDIRVKLGKLKLQNPLFLASGILGLDRGSLMKAVDGGAGAVTMKSLTKEPRKGHNNPILVEFNGGYMNAVGYGNMGIVKGIEEFKKWTGKVPLIGSVVAPDAGGFKELAVQIQETPISALEIVLSCPHTPGFGVLAGQNTPEATYEITKAVRKVTKVPLSVKLSPSVENIGKIAKAAEDAGADIINMGNTHGPGMKIDINRKEPIMDFKVGGVSGPAIKPLVIRCVSDIYQTVKIPIIATGGIMTGEDVIEAFMAGASAIGIGTGIAYRGVDIFSKVTKEIEIWLKKNHYKSINDVKGAIYG